MTKYIQKLGHNAIWEIQTVGFQPSFKGTRKDRDRAVSQKQIPVQLTRYISKIYFMLSGNSTMEK